MKFTAQGHANIRATHRNTLEFTKDAGLTVQGDCIVGVKADYDLSEITQLLSKRQLTMTIKVGELVEEIDFLPNEAFADNHELVVRIGGFLSPRTLGMHATKAAKDMSREMIRLMQDPSTVIEVTIK